MTVKGADATDPARYFFTMETAYNGYNFAGSPQMRDARVKFPEIHARGDLLVTPVYNMIHYPTQRSDDSSAQIRFFKTINTEEAEMLAAIDKDVNGQPIAPPAGKTTNILITFDGSGGFDVTVVITGWDEKYQWNEW